MSLAGYHYLKRPALKELSCIQRNCASSLLSESSNELLERLFFTVPVKILNCDEELSDEVVSVSTQLVLDVLSSLELELSLLWVLELFGLRVIRILELVVRRSGWTAASTFVFGVVVKSHCYVGLLLLFSVESRFATVASAFLHQQATELVKTG